MNAICISKYTVVGDNPIHPADYMLLRIDIIFVLLTTGALHTPCDNVFAMKPLEPDKIDEAPEYPPVVNLADPKLPRKPQRQVHRHHDNPWSALGIITQLGLVMALCIVGSVVGGVYVDRLVGSNGIIVLIMIPVGIGAAALAAWQIIKQELP